MEKSKIYEVFGISKERANEICDFILRKTAEHCEDVSIAVEEVANSLEGAELFLAGFYFGKLQANLGIIENPVEAIFAARAHAIELKEEIYRIHKGEINE